MADDGTAYFPNGLLPKDKLWFRSYTGKRTSVLVVGERKFGQGRMRYNLGVTFYVKFEVFENPVVQLKARLHITDPAKRRLDGKGINARRKSVTKSWWNHEWISRQFALAQYLAKEGDTLIIGAIPERSLAIDATPLSGDVAPSIDDKKLASLREKVKAMNASTVVGADEGADEEDAA